MMHVRSVPDVEADLAALRAAAERAGTALACLFSSSEEFEQAVIRSKIAAGVYGPKKRHRRQFAAAAAVTVLLAGVFLML